MALKDDHPGASSSILEGLEETLTVTRLGLPKRLARSLRSTNPIESMNANLRPADPVLGTVNPRESGVAPVAVLRQEPARQRVVEPRPQVVQRGVEER